MERDEATDIQWACRNIANPRIRVTVRKLLENMAGRRGFKVDSIDDETLANWAQDWAEIIEGREGKVTKS